jgi:hypothetical protein
MSRESLAIIFRIGSNLFEPPTGFGSRVPHHSTFPSHFTSVSSNDASGDEDEDEDEDVQK